MKLTISQQFDDYKNDPKSQREMQHMLELAIHSNQSRFEDSNCTFAGHSVYYQILPNGDVGVSVDGYWVSPGIVYETEVYNQSPDEFSLQAYYNLIPFDLEYQDDIDGVWATSLSHDRKMETGTTDIFLLTTNLRTFAAGLFDRGVLLDKFIIENYASLTLPFLYTEKYGKEDMDEYFDADGQKIGFEVSIGDNYLGVGDMLPALTDLVGGKISEMYTATSHSIVAV